MAESIFTHSNLFAQQVNPAYPMKRGGGFQCYVGGIPFVTLFYPMALTNIHLYIYIYMDLPSYLCSVSVMRGPGG